MRNRENDHAVLGTLRKRGWRVALVWECALRGKTRMTDKVLADLLSDWLNSSVDFMILRGEEGQKTGS
jgi:DNA mismatch endonuclease (patch repair protein)